MRHRLLVVNGHPRWEKSKALKSVMQVLNDGFELEVLELGRGPGNWDIQEQQQAIERAEHIVFLFPLYWYGVPGGMKLWMDEVFTWGWAFDAQGGKLGGKKLICCTSVGAALSSYSTEGKNRRTIVDYLSSIEQFAHYIGLQWCGVSAVQAGDWAGELVSEEFKKDWVQKLSLQIQVGV